MDDAASLERSSGALNELNRDNAGGGNLRLANQLCFPLYAATNIIQRLYRPLLMPLGLTYAQYLVLLVLWDQDQPVSVGELQHCLHLDVSTLSPMLRRMERAGLIERQRDPQDERRVLIGLTPHGSALKAAAENVPETLAARCGVDADEAFELRRLCTALVDQLNTAVARYHH